MTRIELECVMESTKIYAQDMIRCLEHIESQAKQIAALKAALIKERVSKMKNSWPEWQNENKIIADAIIMLARELPEVDWNE